MTIIKRAQSDVLADLPDTCMICNDATDNRVIAVKKGEHGFWPMDGWTAERAERFNTRHGVTPAQAEAMHIGSMFGWSVPGADPLNH